MTTETTRLSQTAYPTYENYKDSGVDWLGEIPENWETKRLKYVVNIKKRIIGHEGVDVLSITQTGVKVKDITTGEGQLSMDYSKYRIVHEGDFAMNHMDLLTGYVDISKYNGVVSPDYRVFINDSNDIDSDYLLKIFQMGYSQKIFFKYGQGVSMLGRWRLPADNFYNFLIPIPTLDEQDKIIEFLQNKTAQIDQAITLKQQQIAKLEEYKQIVIQNAVTKGLNPDAPMKDSGIDWIGDIPETWKLVKTKHWFDIGRGRVISKEELENDGKYPVYSSQTKRNGLLGYISKYDFDCTQLTWTTDGANAGTVFLREGKHNCTNVCGTLKPKLSENMNIRYVYYALGFSTKFYKRPDTNGAKIMNAEMANILFTFPELDEQKDIVSFLDSKISIIDRVSRIKIKQINRLKEYKTILINQAVTGKIKVS